MLKTTKSRQGSFKTARGFNQRTSSHYEDRASNLNSMIKQALDKEFDDVVEEVSMHSDDIGFGLGGADDYQPPLQTNSELPTEEQ